MTTARDAAAAVFNRINRRRDSASPVVDPDIVPAASTSPTPTSPPSPTSPASPTSWTSPTSTTSWTSPTSPPSLSIPEPDVLAVASAEPDTFPRSATMRAILKHPLLAVGVGLPAAGLLLSSPGSRRLLAVALRLGTRPELHQLLQLSAAARGLTPSLPRQSEPTREFAASESNLSKPVDG